VGPGTGAMQQHDPTVKQAAGNHSRKQPFTGSSNQYSMQHADSRQHHANSRRAQQTAGSRQQAADTHAAAQCGCTLELSGYLESVAAARTQLQWLGWGG
jgi:hypothetical protein